MKYNKEKRLSDIVYEIWNGPFDNFDFEKLHQKAKSYAHEDIINACIELGYVDKKGFIIVDMTELKPCPFCGDKSTRYSDSKYGVRVTFICRNCGDCGPQILPKSPFREENEAELKQRAIESWNTRAGPVIDGWEKK